MTFFRSVGHLVERNYEILFDEARGEGTASRAIVFLVFVAFPALAGVVYGLASPDWVYFAGDFLLAIATFTGFLLVALVLLYSSPAAASDRLDADGVTRLRTVLAYLLLVGVSYLAVGLFELSFLNASSGLYYSNPVFRMFLRLELPTIASYVILIHYLLFVLVLVGRFHRLNVESGIVDSASGDGGEAD